MPYNPAGPLSSQGRLPRLQEDTGKRGALPAAGGQARGPYRGGRAAAPLELSPRTVRPGRNCRLSFIAAKITQLTIPFVRRKVRSEQGVVFDVAAGAAPRLPPAPSPAIWRGAKKLPPLRGKPGVAPVGVSRPGKRATVRMVPD